MPKRNSTPSGLLLIDKPIGPTSRAILDDLEKGLGLRGIGHAGTLDPLASGLLVVLVGRLCRFQDEYQRRAKTYIASLRFGVHSSTDDAEGELTTSSVAPPADLRAALESVLGSFLGEIAQVPPAYSAVWVGGMRSYALAREGKPPPLTPRRVRIDELSIVAVHEDLATIRVTCSAGTYIRSLARDLGDRFGCGAFLTGLRRVRSGGEDVRLARAPAAATREHIVPIEELFAPRGRIDVSTAEAQRLRLGQPILLLDRAWPEHPDGVFAWHEGRLFCRLHALGPDRVRSDLLLAENWSAG